MNKIYYFTGSGNSLAIAQRVAEKTEECELIRVTSKTDCETPVTAEILGFVFPVYAWGMPLLFKEFLTKLQIQQAEYVFVITNYGGNCGNVMGLFNKIMTKKGRRIDAFGEVVMPSNYVMMGDASSEHKAANILQIAEAGLEQLADDIANRKKLTMKKASLGGKLSTAIFYNLFAKSIHKSDKTFFVTDKCNGCGICAKVCPAENIIPDENKHPVWQQHCEQCHACFHWCPQQAIEFNQKTSTKNRYTHPNVRLSQLL